MENSLESIRSMIATEEQKNQDINSALSESNNQDTMFTSIVTPTLPSVADAASNSAATQYNITIDNLVQAYPETKLKLNIIIKKWDAP